MATFTKDQLVISNKEAPVVTIAGMSMREMASGALARIVDGPKQIMNKAGEFWLVNTLDGLPNGYVNGNKLDPFSDEPNPPGQTTGRRIWVGVPEGGDGHEVNRLNWGGGYVKADPAHDFWLNYNPGVFAVAVEYAWNEALRDWVFKIENRGQGGEYLFQEPHGWVKFEHGTSRDPRLNRLEVYRKDTGPDLPDFLFAPSETPPPPPPPVEEPDEPPMPEPVDTTGQVENGGFEGGVKPTPPGVSGLLPEGWELLWWADANTPKIERQDTPWHAPEIMVNSASQLTDDLKPIPEGQKVLHIFKGWAPTWCKLGRKVHLTPGTYAASAYVFFDPVDTYSPKRYGQDPITSEFSLYLAEGPAEAILVNQGDNPPGAWRKHASRPEIVTTEGDYTFVLEFRGRFGMRHNGAFFDNVRLVKQDDNPPPPPPDPEPEPTPGLDRAAVLARVVRLEAGLQGLGAEVRALRELAEGEPDA